MPESVKEYLGIVIDYSRDNLLPEKGMTMLTKKGFYKKDNETSPQETFARAATCYSFGDYEFAQRIYDYVSKGYFMFASPVLSNAVEINWPTFGEHEFSAAGDWLEENVTPEGMPISCFLAYIPDTKEGLVNTRAETAWLSMMGGGIGIYAANRSPDEKSTGVMAHLRGYDADALSYKQTESRRGSIAVYLDVTHPEIMQFLQMRNPVGGDLNKKCFNLNHAVNIPDSFMEAVIKGEDYELVDPKHGPTGKFLNAREVWEEILNLRYETGEPYIMFTDNVNRQIPEWVTNPLYKVNQSNLCVAPETLILTDKGYQVIADLEGEEVNVWNGEEWSKVTVFKTGENQKLVKVVVDSGQELECTPYHKFYVQTQYGVVEKRAGELAAGDKLISFSMPESDDVISQTVVSVEDEGRYDDTYCFTEPKRHMGVFNGILTGQCSEITLMTDAKRTAVCCLSSLNLEKYDEWKDTNIVQDLIRFLDNVIEYFIRLAPSNLSRAVYSASSERSIGLGTMGWHSYLQSKMIPFEGDGFNSAVHHTRFLFKKIKERAVEESRRLAKIRGEAPDCAGSGMRNAHLLAIAPNASSSSIIGTSPSIEPWNANAFTSQGRAGAFLIKNKYLERLLEEKGKNTQEVWKSIVLNEGSVQHLDFLTEHEKAVFKTAYEIAPEWIVIQAAERQKYVCQSMSLNIFVDDNMTAQRMSDLHITGWLKGLKTFYYCRSKPATRAKLGDGGEKPLNSIQPKIEIKETECLACEG